MSHRFDGKRFQPPNGSGELTLALIASLLAAVGIYAALGPLDVAEVVFDHTRHVETWEADELVVAAILFLIAYPASLTVVLARRAGRLRRANAVLLETARHLEAARAEAAGANRVKDCFLRHIHHELRTPLNAIVGFTEVMEREMFGPIGNEAYRGYLKDIHGSSIQLRHVLTQVLELTAVESGTLRLSEGPARLHELAGRVAGDLSALAMRQGVSVVNRIGEAYPMLLIDGPRLRQALYNVAENAVQACEAGGVVTLDAQANGEGGLAVVVADNGIGMASDEVRRAVIPFEQIHREQLGRHEGSGLGLTLSVGLLRLHGGRVEIDSAPGRGTTVRLLLPKERVMPGGA